jgi:hypothetical protein
MTLENLLRIGKLKAHAASTAEIERLLASATRALEDTLVQRISAATRFSLAYRAMMQAAMAAMVSNGYRPATSEPGHHQLLLQSLSKTIGLAPNRVQVLDALRSLRNRLEYSGDEVSDAVAMEAVEEARRLLAEVEDWIRKDRSSV